MFWYTVTTQILYLNVKVNLPHTLCKHFETTIQQQNKNKKQKKQ